MNAFYERRPDEMTVFHADSIDFPAHFHESLEMFYAIEEGHLVTAGGREQKMGAGDLALIFPGSIHAYGMEEGVAASPALLAVAPLPLSRTLPMMKLRKKSGEHTIVYQLVDILSREYREQLTLEGLSKRLGVSRFTLSRVFSEQIGCGFPEYVNRLRLNEAETMLANTGLPITEISYRCGFETPRTFNRVFRGQLGVTPREYRSIVKSSGQDK